jgi:hypothetical protein
MSYADSFGAAPYQRHNRRRQEHLATLALPFAGKRVLEVGAGIGDHTDFLLDRGCRVTCTDGRAELVEVLRSRHPSATSLLWNVEEPPPPSLQPHEVVYAYGVLYHTRDPGAVLERLSHLCAEFLALETCVSFGTHMAVNPVPEPSVDPTQAVGGMGCRPTRPWIMNFLESCFAHVYVSRTQPWHEEFPVDWTRPELHPPGVLARSVFVASRRPLDERLLSPELVDVQTRD